MVRNESQEWYNFAFPGLVALEKFFPLFPTDLRIVERTDSWMRKWAREVAEISFRDLYRAEKAFGAYRVVQTDRKSVGGRKRKVWRFFPLRLPEESRLEELPETLPPEKLEGEFRFMMKALEDFAITLSDPDFTPEEFEALLPPTGALAMIWFSRIARGLRHHRMGGGAN